jgi:uncharacterized membrane protein (DUF373 family)
MAGDDPNLAGARIAGLKRVVLAFESAVVRVLLLLLMLVVVVSVFDLGLLLYRDFVRSRQSLLDPEEMFGLFGSFLLVLVGLELMSTLKAYLVRGVVQVEVVLEVALIAVAQKIIILDTSRVGPIVVFGVATLVLALAVAFRLALSAHK